MNVNGKFTDIYSYVKNILFLMVLLTVGGTSVWGQAPFTLTTADDVTNGTEKLYWMESNGATGFYMIAHTNNVNNNNNTYVSTSNMPNERMLWYFMDAGDSYYYIVNKSTGKYLKQTGNNGQDNTIQLAVFGSGGDAYKFSVGGSEGQWIFYPKTGSGNYWINKKSGNVPYNNAWLKSSNYGGSPDENSKWCIIPEDDITWTHPFTDSSEEEVHYYNIRNKSNTSFYISTNGSDYATISNQNNNNKVWLFKEASSGDYNLKYYYIINVETGKYMYYNGATTGTAVVNDAVNIQEHSGGDEDRYQFAILDAKGNTWNAYAIMPKVLIGLYDFKYTSLGNTTLTDGDKIKTAQDRGNNNNPAHWTIEPVDNYLTAPAITYDKATNKFTITSTEGGTIYYTTDGTTPTASTGIAYPEGGFVMTNEMTEIKAVAVVSPAKITPVATKEINTYTFKIVNASYKVAVIKTEKLPEGTPLNAYTDIPADIRSEYLSEESVYFRSFAGSEGVGDDVTQATLENHNQIHQTPTGGDANIYVNYTTRHLMEKFLHLRAFRTFNVKVNSSDYKFLWDDNSGTNVDQEAAAGETATKAEKPYMWYFGGNDPYAVFVQNVGTSRYLRYASSNLTLEGSETFIMKESDPLKIVSEEGTGTVTLQNAAGETIDLIVTPVALPLHFCLIDKAGQIIDNDISYTGDFSLPAAWRSPLCTYKYYKAASESGGTFTFDEGNRITGIDGLGDGNVIYVTYDVDTDQLDLDGRNSLERTNKVNTSYRLQFSGGTNFYQEDGKDGVMTETRKPVYPYSNGDAALYVYGNERWEEQLASGASTRTRWLWYIEPGRKLTKDNTLADLDPYHVKISSYQTQTNYKIDDDNTRNFHSYLKTYAVSYGDPAVTHIVTGVTNDNPLVTGKAKDQEADNSDATQYMLLGPSLSQLKLVTVEAISDGTTTERRTVNSFEQYWKNNPTVQDKLTTEVTTVGRNVTLTPTQKTELEHVKVKDGVYVAWHVYEAWANSQPWKHNDDASGGEAPTTTKKFLNEEHVFQTIQMGDGTFQFVPTDIKPMLILLDQHGWEIVRLPLPSGPTDPKRPAIYADIHKYSSPMVERYHYWKTGTKVPGYHQYTVKDYATDKDDSSKEYTTAELGVFDASTNTGNLPDYESQALVSGKERDWYVTYDVKSEYASTYAGAATKGATSAAPYLIKQNGRYAQISGTSLTSTDTEPDIKNVPKSMQWYLRPNFDIDEEMGYIYIGNPGAQEEADTKANTEAAYFAAGKNGFDPYNVQIQSVADESRYFTANTSGSTVTSLWAGTSTGISLQEMQMRQNDIIGLDQVDMKITNATFMVVADRNGNMRLMPRFDNTKVMQSFTTLASPAKEGTDSIAQAFTLTMVPKVVNSSSEINAMGGYYMLGDNFTASGSIGTSTAPFKGTIEGQLDKTFDVSAPFIAYAEDATIKNIIIGSASITSGNDDAHAGAIVATALGDTRVYNCGVNDGSISGTNHVGGIVGHLDGNSRVINCYSYADIEGGSDKGGIVGYNTFKSKAGNLKTMVMNCMFYGDISRNNNVSPIYGGEIIENRKQNAESDMGLANYNYYAYETLKTGTINKYNCALAIEERYLKRFELYRQLLNSNKRLAAYYATGSASNADQMAKWVLETADRSITDPKPYPILKAQGTYPSIINYDTSNLDDYDEDRPEDRNKGLKIGELSVTISGVGDNAPTSASITDGSLTLTRTDKDFEHFNFNYDKVQLPYFDEVGSGNYGVDADGKSRVMVGWEITGMTVDSSVEDRASQGSFTTSDTWNGYNFADRKTWAKDLFSESGRIFSQGAYFDVPYGVTSITIKPHWAQAVYVADEYLDVVYNTSYGAGNVTKLGKQFPTGKITIGGSEQTVYTSVSAATAKLGSGGVYDNAIVLVGNLHQGSVPKGNSKKFTMMSVDLDEDHEPDYSMIYHDNNRTTVEPIRFDFINMPGTAQAQKPNTAGQFRNAAVFDPLGWFEVTNTCLIYFSQFEYENKNKTAPAPIILLGGVFDQFVSTQKGSPTTTTYIHVGSNAWLKDFGNGTHSDGSGSTTHVPVSVTGGEYKDFHLTGTYNADAAPKNDDAECYISGGHFEECAGAGLEQINGNVRWQIYNADIDNFYGGGINDATPVQGTITTDIFNSHVGTFCGGPKFGNMEDGKDVTTTAKGCTFDKYFGAGFGGNSISKKKYYDKDGAQTWSTLEAYYEGGDKGKYYDGETTKVVGHNGQLYGYKGPGVAVDFDYEYFVWTSGSTGARFFVKYATFSLAQCHNVSSTLTGCTINQNFYGGGNLGNVTGKATSILDGCTVHGNVFGGGYSASLPTISFRTGGFKSSDDYPNVNTNSGMFEDGEFSDTEEYSWKYDASVTLSNGGTGTGTDPITGKKFVYSAIPLTGLGQVGETDVTVKGNTVVDGKIFDADGTDTGEQTGGVFGGGDESAVNGNAQVKIQKADDTADAPTVQNVFGGGNTADVNGDATVMMAQGIVTYDIYGGGKGAGTAVGGDVKVHFGKTFDDNGAVALTGSPTVTGNVYGGSALGNVNTTVTPATSTYDKTTQVNIYNGTVGGSVFGGGLGHDDTEDDTNDIVAKNYGATTVTMEAGTVSTAVYGGANENGVVKGNTTVSLTGGTVGTAPETATNIANTVFGGGYGQPTLVEGSVSVTIGTSAATPDNTKPTIYGSVYGGSALGGVNVNEAGDDQTAQTVAVNLYGGTINGNVFGGGLGQKTGVNEATSNIAARVGGSVNVLLDGAKLNCTFTGTDDNRMPASGQIFGCNNLNGTPKGQVMVHVKRTMGTDKSSPEALAKTRDQRGGLDPYSYDVAAVYGGGNQADYVPTDATITLPASDDENYETELNKKNAACAKVLIEGCDLTSIEYVYGGGNAAAVPATEVTILGDYIINYVFGGGNGKSTTSFTNPGANVGSYDNTDYGSGKAVTKLVGGHIMYVFGGSNTLGNVRGGTSILMPDATSYPSPTYNCCAVRDIKEIYGAGNEAEQDGDVTLILGCVSNMKNVYGGARNANVKGGIDLVVTSGSFEGVYGGNDQSGTIQGPITLTIEETGCDPLIIDNLYLGGNQAAYSIYGYNSDGTARTKAEYDALTAEQKAAEGLPYRDPILNVVSCTRIGKTSGEDLGGAFGGGYGTGAVMYGNPTVNINMIPGKFGADTNSDNIPDVLGTITNVYGGGKEANVEGNTTVNIGTEEKMAHRTSMGAELPEASRVEKDVLPAIITNNVFGAGKGLANDVTSALVTGNTTLTIGSGSIAKSVYGGGELSQVGGNTNITVRGGAIGDPTGSNAGETYGNVYGGGKGNTTNVRSGLVKGNTNITIENTLADATYATAHSVDEGSVITSPSIYHSVYGGGAHGSVGTYTYASEADGAAINGYTSGGAANITITGGTIGVNGHENGMVFGSSRGDVGAPESIYDNVAWVNSTNVVIGTEGQGTNHTTPHIKGSVYGGGENGHVRQNASVTIHSGMVGIAEDTPITDNNGTPEDPSDDITYTGANYPYRGNVYGAGCGTDKYDNNTKYNPMSGYVGGTASVTIDGGHVVRDVYGAGSMGSVNESTTVTIDGDAEIGAEGSGGGYVFAAARGDASEPTMATVGSSNLIINGGTIWMDAFGGGQNGAVKGAVTVSMTDGTVKGDVYGGGALANTNTDNWVTDHLVYTDEAVTGLTVDSSPVDGYFTRSGSVGSYTYTPASGKAADATTYYRILKATNITMTGGTIEGKLYGGGLGQKTGINEATSDIAANVYSPVLITMSGGLATDVFGCNNINGAPQTAATIVISGGTIANSVYGGGNVAAFTGNTNVTMSDGSAGYIYGGGLGSTAIVTGDTRVAISGGTINQDVYGGGSQADVTGDVNVSVSGGEVKHDVYGGGALANTNTANTLEAAGTNSNRYFEVLNLKYKEDLPEGRPKSDASNVKGYYTLSGSNYTPISSDTYASKNTKYYKQINLSEKAYNDVTNGTTKKTNVSLTGGVIGNAYGGGLGKLGTDGTPDGTGNVKAMVYGDVSVTVNGAAFTQDVESSAKNAPVTGRVFGCNNINGTPKGSVTVTVNSTRRIDGGAHVLKQFEVQGVYGGGNLADYDPTTFDVATEFGQRTRVIIDGCDATSISKVYGGGNAARVPYTDVTINGAFEIGYVFGGGNGGDMIYKNSAWIDNPGAYVTGYTNVLLKGGTIGQAFGGSDSRGSVGGSNVIQSSGGSCALHLVNLYGAGNGEEANSDGDINIRVSSCGDYSEIQNVYGGSYKANIKGSVTLTITSGIFTSVYGGNDRMGSIGGNITVNIEETDKCDKPIIIQNLYGGCYQTEYPGAGAETWNRDNPKTYTPFTRGKITVNVKAATRIDRIFGGSEEGLVNGDTEVNINMVRGSMSNHNAVLPSYYANPGAVLPSNISNITSNEWVVVTGLTANETSVVGYYTRSGQAEPYTYTIVDNTVNEGKAQSGVTYYKQAVKGDIANAIGTIGDVYGGGNIGNVNGHTTVNIGTETKAVFITEPEHLGTKGTDYTEVDGKFEAPVKGAHITGDVYGGCYAATVRDSATVNICAKYDDEHDEYVAVTEGAEGVTIAGSVFGGGKGIADSFTCAKGMVGDETNDGNDGTAGTRKGTHVLIGHGTIGKNVYGGGETGRVEWDTEVTVGYGNGTGGAKTPVIQGSVFGGGQGVVTHGYSALVRGNSSVTVQGDAKVGKSIYGGSEVATVGKYWVYTDPLPEGAPDVPDGVSFGMPYATRSGGECTVKVQGYAQVGPDDAANVSDDAGHVFGGGMGIKPNYKYDPTNTSTLANSSKRMVVYNSTKYKPGDFRKTWDYFETDHNFVWEYFPQESDYLKYLETLALVSDTYVTIDGHTTVKGNVYGGSQNGFLQRDADVKIQSANVIVGTEGSFGNVFGGGKGVLRFDKAGRVRGDTKLTITGGTIHGSVYGGGELGFVGKFSYNKDTKEYSWQTIKDKSGNDKTPGLCTVNISGSTTIKGSVFGAGMGSDDTFECEQAMVRKTSVTISAGTVEKNVYGGGKVARVDQNAVVTLGVADASGDAAPDIKGSVYGAGQGVETHGYSGLARGNTTVTIQGTTKIGKSVYGGGEVAAVGRYGLDSSGMPSTLVSGGYCEVTIQDHAIIGYDGGGNVYGGSKGVDESLKTYTYVDNDHRPKRMMSYSSALYNDTNSAIWEYTASDHKYVWEYFDTRTKYLNFLQTLALATDTHLTIDESATVNGSAYGGSESGFVQRNTEVEIKGSSHVGTTSPVLIGHVFGGGKGVRGFDKAGRVRGNTEVTIGGSAQVTGNVYGGGELGFVGKFNYTSDGKSYLWQNIKSKTPPPDSISTGASVVTITGGTIGYEGGTTANHASGHVFGAGKGEDNTFKCEPAIMRTASVSITNGTVYGNVYGGGQIARVDENTSVTIGDGDGVGSGSTPTSAPDIKGSVFGAGAGVETHGYSALVRGNTTVIVEGNAKVKKNVYGGGEIASVGKYSLDENNMPTSLVSDNLGIDTVIVRGYAQIGYDGADENSGHLFGASKGVVPAYAYNTSDLAHSSKRMTLYTNSTDFPANKENVTWQYYATGSPFVWEYFDTEDKYETFLQTLALTTQAIVTVGGNATIKGNVYGGSENAFVQHHVSVTVNNGTIGTAGSYGNIYGGGKGLETFDVAGRVSGNVTLNVNGGTMHGSVYGGGELGIVKKNVTVEMTGGSVGNNLYGGGALADTNTDNWNTSTNSWADATKKSALYTTHVIMKGGSIAHNAYGGALGRFEKGTSGTPGYESLVEPKVYGDILVELNGKTTVVEGTVTETPISSSAKGCIVEKVFGCNDMKGTPKGHVKVHVYATQHKNKGTIAQADKYAQYRKLSDYIDNYATYVSELDALATEFGVKENASYISYKTILANTDWSGMEGTTNADKQAALLKQRNKALDDIRDLLAAKYDVLAVYGGGDLAEYKPFGPDANNTDADYKATKEFTEVIIDGCNLTSIKQVYGGGNAAPVPATDVSIVGTYEIDEVFGGGNGKDNYMLSSDSNSKWYENPGANVGYYNYTHYLTNGTKGTGDEGNPYLAIENSADDEPTYHNASTKEYRQAWYMYGTGQAKTDIIGGRIHKVYGGSNEKGNISTLALSVYETATDCPIELDETYGAGKNAEIDGEARVSLECVDYTATLFGGATNADVNNDVTLNITNGHFGKVFGGNNTSGNIRGSITVNVKEQSCKPIVIGELYAGGYLAKYSVYGYSNEGTADAPDWKPRTKAEYEAEKSAAIAELGANPTEQQITEKLIAKGLYGYPKADPRVNIISATRIDEVYGGGYQADVIGSPHINVNMENGIVTAQYANADDAPFSVGSHTVSDTSGGYSYEVTEHPTGGNATLAIGTIGNIFGGGNQADIFGNTYVDIGTGEWFNWETKTTEAISRKAAFITGNVYGGGNMGHVGNFTKTSGKPTSCTVGTGVCNVTVSNGDIGPNDMKMTASGGPDNAGHVFGGGKGSNHPDYDNYAYVDYANVTVNGTAWVKGDVFGGGEDGHVLHDTHVVIDGNCQIGNGHILNTTTSADRGVNRRYTAAEWAAGHLFVEGDPDITTPLSTEESALRTAAGSMFTASLPECASWPYTDPYKPHDIYGVSGSTSATDGHTFYGNVFGGGSGYFPYASDQWNVKAGRVEGNTLLEIKGGHILTSAYGGGELANVGDGTLTGTQGKATVRMTGGTLGVPRTLAQIDAHPVTCYLFGAGKGDQHTHFNKDTNVKEVEMEVTGGRIYGSVFGGGEDGHVLGDVKMTIGNSDGTGPTIGTLGTSYVDGNIFGGGRGFSGEALTAGNVGGSVDLSIKGGIIKGSVYGGGRLGSVGYGLYATDDANYGVMREDDKDDEGNATTYYTKETGDGLNKNGRGNIVINISGGTIGNDLEYVYVNADNAASVVGQGDIAKTEFRDAVSFTEKVKDEGGLITEATSSTTYRRLSHTKGGSVFGGSMGRIYKLDGSTPISNWDKLGHAKSTTVTVSGNAHIKSSVFGGSELGQVEGNTTVTVSGGTIGTEVTKTNTDGEDVTQYGFGAVYGGGYGSETSLSSPCANPREVAGQIGGNTTVNMSGGKVKGSVYGGGKNAMVLHNTYVNISGGEVGINKVRKDDGYVMYGGDAVGNVYGGGKGSLTDARMGVVKGNTNVNITGGNIYHMVYGGGALASVGTFNLSDGAGNPPYMPIPGIPYGWTEGTGTATVNVTGGTIGISGRDNGLIFGSSRGGVSQPVAVGSSIPVDPYLKVAWVDKAVVNIGNSEAKSTDADYLTKPLIKGSVYGGGENGHNYTNATVNVYSGTIGITDTNDKWYDYLGEDELVGLSDKERTERNKKYQSDRGNVYGAGSGADTYTAADGTERYNPKTGMVGGNTFVNIMGGHIGRSVYGAGSMASVGNITNGTDTLDVTKAKHYDETNSFALSWPYKFVFSPTTGKTIVKVTGGHIGTEGIDGGDVYGGARGKAGDRYAMAHLANVRETHVTVDFPYNDEDPSTLTGSANYAKNCIEGAIYGGGENGHVNEDTYVTLKDGFIAKSVLGGGRGEGTYTGKLLIVGTGKGRAGAPVEAQYTRAKQIYDWLSGKVYGNTHLTIVKGRIMHNVLGGGNLASVGKGGYSSGTDDYYPTGYGETIKEPLWTSSATGDNAWEFLNSGNTYVNVFGGEIGSMELYDGLPAGNIFGGSRGVATPNLRESYRYLYNPEWLNGYVNETHVTIGGGYVCAAACTDKNSTAHAVGEMMSLQELQEQFAGTAYLDADNMPVADYWTAIDDSKLKIWGSVYGGAQDGRVRRDANVTVNAGEIGVPYTTANQTAFGTSDIDNAQWLHRGNVYGAGSGISMYKFDANDDDDTSDLVNYYEGKLSEVGNSQYSGTVLRFTNVDILGGVIHRNVYGGGSMGSVGPPAIPPTRPDVADKKGDTTTHGGKTGWQSQNTVNIKGTVGTPFNAEKGWKYNQNYGGEVYGACRGMSNLNADQYATSVWTEVNVKNGAVIMGNVYGGGDNGLVKKDTDVKIGE